MNAGGTLRAAATWMIAGLALAGCSYTAPVVAPPMRIDPPAEAQLEPAGLARPDRIDGAIAERLGRYARLLRAARSAADLDGDALRPLLRALYEVVAKIPYDRRDLEQLALMQRARQMVTSEAVWAQPRSRHLDTRLAASGVLEAVAAPLSRLSRTAYAASPEARLAAADLDATLAVVGAHELATPSIAALATALAQAEDVLVAIHEALARGDVVL